MQKDRFFLSELNIEVVGYTKDKNGNITLKTRDYGNHLNRISNQKLIEKYNKNGIELEKSFVGTQASTIASLYEYERLGINYGKEYKDFSTTALLHTALSTVRDSLVKSAHTKASLVTREAQVSSIEKGKKTRLKEIRTSKKVEKAVVYDKEITESITVKFEDLTEEEVIKKMNQITDEMARDNGRTFGGYGSGVIYDYDEYGLKSGIIQGVHAINENSVKMCMEDVLVRNLGEGVKIGPAVGFRFDKEEKEVILKIPVCYKCQKKYGKEQFFEGVIHQSGGKWDGTIWNKVRNKIFKR